MSRPSIVWTVLFAVYAAFATWYTSCGGPLSPEEIAHYTNLMAQRGRAPDEVASVRAFLESDTGDDFVVVNIVELREPPTPVDGVLRGETASQVLDKYMEYMYPALFARACHPVLVGRAAAPALDVWGIDDAETWTMAGMMRYRSRRDLMEIATNPAFAGRHEFKVAAMIKTIAFPIDPWFHLGDPRFVLALLLLVVGLTFHGFEGHRRATARARDARAVALVVLACIALACAPERRTNLLLVSLDTTRADHLSVYGYPKRTTPHLEALAAEGAKFTNAYSATATTGPSHATLFTSLYPYTHGLLKNGLVLDDDWITLAEVLADEGYDTHGVLGSFPLTSRLGFAQGFAAWDEDFDPATSSYHQSSWMGQRVRSGFDRPADETTRRALAWLRADTGSDRDTARPFLLFVHYFDAHDPYAPPDRFRRNLPSGPAQVRVLYDGELGFVDEQIGVLLEGLAAEGLAENTLVVVVGDHGEGLMDRGHMAHGRHLYDEGVHVPLLMRLPGTIPAGSVYESPVGAVDLAPTILDLLGVPADASAAFAAQSQGQSLAKAIRAGREPERARPVYLTRRQYERPETPSAPVGEEHAVRVARWKYFEAPEERPPELYDLSADPGERHNVVAREPAKAGELSHLLHAWRSAQAPRGPTPEVEDDVREGLEALGYTE